MCYYLLVVIDLLENIVVIVWLNEDNEIMVFYCFSLKVYVM